MIGPSEVPDFVHFSETSPRGRDANGHPISRRDRTNVTSRMYRVEGPVFRLDHSQKKFTRNGDRGRARQDAEP